MKDLQIDEAIRDKEVGLVGSNGEQVEVVDTAHAQSLADEAKLDLIRVAPGAKPSVCHVIDYGRYKYDLMKKEKEFKKK